MAKKNTIAQKDMREGVECLLRICRDEEQKPADRIAAAKVLLDYGLKGKPIDAGALRVIMEGVPDEYLV